MFVTLKKNNKRKLGMNNQSNSYNQPVLKKKKSESSFKRQQEVINEGKDVVCILYFRGQILYYWC